MKRNWLQRRLLFSMLTCGLLLVHALAPGVARGKTAGRVMRSEGTPEIATNATLANFAWLEGDWQGSWGPRSAQQLWTEPKAGEMLGLSRIVENEKTLVIEIYSLLATSDGIELRLRHFTPALLPWEQAKTTVLKLASFDETSAVFENQGSDQPRRLTLIRTDPETYVSRSEIESTSDNKQVTEIQYHKQKTTAEAPAPQKRKK